MKTFAENNPPVDAIGPATAATDLNGDFISLKNGPVAVFVHITQGNAANVQLTITQATNVAGAGAKALAEAVPIFSNLDCAGSDALVRRNDAVDYTTDAALARKIVVFEINPTDLDQANGFDCIRVNALGSNVANVVSAVYIPKQKRYSNADLISD